MPLFDFYKPKINKYMKLTNKDKKAILKGLTVQIRDESSTGSRVSFNTYLKFTKLADEFCKKVYLDYVNNFLTVSKFASYYGITEQEAVNFINNERRIAS
jgi:hypothetical protein